MTTYVVRIKAFGHERVMHVDARYPDEARKKALLSVNFDCTVTEKGDPLAEALSGVDLSTTYTPGEALIVDADDPEHPVQEKLRNIRPS